MDDLEIGVTLVCPVCGCKLLRSWKRIPATICDRCKSTLPVTLPELYKEARNRLPEGFVLK